MPFVKDPHGHKEFGYEEWLKKFAISVVWRAMVTSKIIDSLNDEQQLKLKVAAEFIRQYLNGIIPLKYEIYLVFLSNDKTLYETSESNQLYAYLMRSTGVGFFNGRNMDFDCGVGIKLPGMVLLLPIATSPIPGWEAVRIKTNGLISTIPTLERSYGLYRYIEEEALYAFSQSTTDKQRKKFEESIHKYPGRTEQSESFQAYMIDKLRNKAKQDS